MAVPFIVDLKYGGAIVSTVLVSKDEEGKIVIEGSLRWCYIRCPLVISLVLKAD
ncbi:hypothetical protein A2U01_0056181 [Trifolium medium]|uniref:Uncharacterized protein n=1 Tax=Trifolium medium TaxID=97028 RepID=A0A392RGP4_9FABA|nr:hypothetical protein [Trifolium medium]